MKVFLIFFAVCVSLSLATDYCKLSCTTVKNNKTIVEENSRCNCSPVKDCTVHPMTDEIRNSIVDLHNRVRSRLATGKEPLYPKEVANMREMSYDMELEKMAECHANKCKKGHDTCRKTEEFPSVGQNIFKVSGKIFDDKWLSLNRTQKIKAWYNEIKDMDPTDYDNYQACVAVSLATDYCELTCEKYEKGKIKNEVNTRCLHEDCSPVQGCKNHAMTDEIRQKILDVHNKLRSKIASGTEPLYKGEVANMREMSYDMDLEKMAECHANQCMFSHDKCRRTPAFTRVGQNIYQSSSSVFWQSWLSENQIYKLKMWYDEIKDMDNSNYANYQNKHKPGAVIGHFTQFVWAESYKIGCARSSSEKNQFLIICNYGPAGNFINNPVFISGSKCSECPPGTTCSENYDGLCS
ncbi:unnamed protein product [Brassicogethes aeneus]|uniref:SCP domain-containing protein n=1 Tax=Brassicogethes aeneus TaxID=1431903 RepID=A0A9P0FFX0_BRAAE|nr:unnamed protein product [Brassicogethes aeneus]